MEIRRTESGDIHFFDDNGDVYEVIWKDGINPTKIKRPQHPMCRCTITPGKATVEIILPYISKALVGEYMGENTRSPIWRN